MRLRCKPGDLVILVGGYDDSLPPRKGAVFKVTLLDQGWNEPTWKTEPTFRDPVSGCRIVVADKFLQPIRDQPGDDETLAWAGKPVTTKRLTEQEFDTITSVWSKS